MPKCVDTEKVSEDAQGRTVKIGDTVFSMAKNYRSLIEAKVVDITPKTLLVEYVNNWNYSRGVVERYRVGSDQIMFKFPEIGRWEQRTAYKLHCSVCNGQCDYATQYCPNFGAYMGSQCRQQINK